MRPGYRHLALGLGLLALIGVGPARASAEDGELPGATAASVLTLGRQLSPELRAMALERDAASARAGAAGHLDDPTFRAMSDEVDRTSGPRINKTYLSFEQEFPLWGKLDLQRSATQAAVDAARGREQATAAELDEKIKVAFARYYTASQALVVNRDIARLAAAMAKLAKERYAQNLAAQTDAITAEAEITRTAMETARLEAERRAAAARLNALLARPPAGPLAEPKELRRLPPVEPPLVALLDRARAGNPRLFTGAAEIRAAASERELAEKAWYPNVTLGAGAIQRDNGPPGYTATLAFKIPLQWAAKEAGERESTAKLGAAQQRLIQIEAEIGGDLEQALATLAAARQVGDLTRRQLLPQLEAAQKSALALYRRDQGTLTAVIEAEHRIHQAQLDLLRADNDAQTALAAIERLIGAEL
jgi:cobalt-zinc-cadmium efflux system outer membrane protein